MNTLKISITRIDNARGVCKPLYSISTLPFLDAIAQAQAPS